MNDQRPNFFVPNALRENRLIQLAYGKDMDTPKVAASLPVGLPGLRSTIPLMLALSESADALVLDLPSRFYHHSAATFHTPDTNITAHDAVELLDRLRGELPHTPIIWSSDFQHIYHYGVDSFVADFSEAGGDALMISNLPYEESYSLSEIASAQGIALLFAVYEKCTEEHISMIMEQAQGFLHLGVPYSQALKEGNLESFMYRAQRVMEEEGKILPVWLGGNLSSTTDYETLAPLFGGFIIASPILRAVGESIASGDSQDALVRGAQTAFESIRKLIVSRGAG